MRTHFLENSSTLLFFIIYHTCIAKTTYFRQFMPSIDDMF